MAESQIFGFWVFMMSDLVTFGMFFAIYASSLHATAGGPGPKDLFDLASIAWQTGFLLLSSLTSGLVVLTLKHRHAEPTAEVRRLIGWIFATILLGVGFIIFEIQDFLSIAANGGAPQRSAWLSSFWALVGLHGLHVASGILWCGVILLAVLLRGIDQRVKLSIMRWVVFWHFLDIVWIGIFSFVFLGGLLA